MTNSLLIGIGILIILHALAVNWGLERISASLDSIDKWLESIDKEINKPVDHD